MSNYQRFEATASIGGFSPEQATVMPFVVLQERNNMHMPLALREDAMTAKRAFEAFMKAIHQAQPRQEFTREMLFAEAFMNLIIHGNQGNAELQSQARLTVERDRAATGQKVSCILSLNDHSPTFDIDTISNPTEPDNLERPTGRGILLIRNLCKATISQIPHPGGKTITYAWTEDTVLPETAEAAAE